MTTTDDIESKLSQYVDENMPLYIERLREAVAIQSVSADPEKVSDDIIMLGSVGRVWGFLCFATFDYI